MAAIDFVRPLCAGIDEAGRGCLAGPVVAAAVILPYGFELPGLDDSKALSAKKRARLEIQIKECARAYGLGVVWPVKIDRINILQATFAAMAHAVSRLKLNPGLLLIDGNQAIPPHILEEALARSEKRCLDKKLSFMATALNRQSPQPQSWPKLFATES